MFDLIDESKVGELDTVDSKDFKPVVDACTLCDMCFMTKCPYVPPHEFNLDFPHLMLRYRAVEQKKGQIPFSAKQLTKTDRNGKLASKVSGLANWAGKCGNSVTRPIMESVADIHRDAKLPEYSSQPFARAQKLHRRLTKMRPRMAAKPCSMRPVLQTTTTRTSAMRRAPCLRQNGVETEVVYPRCCGMPQLEQGDIAAVAESAKQTSADLMPWIEKGYDVIALVPSCALMLKFEWPLLVTRR